MLSERTTADCFNCCSRGSSEWCCLTDAELGQVRHAKIARAHSPGTVLYAQGDESDGIYCIEKGLVGIRRLDEHGNSTLLRMVNPGETIGYRAFLRSRPHENSAEILMPSRLCFIDRRTVRGLLSGNPKLGLQFLDHSFRDLIELEDRYMESVTWKARTKLLHLLLVLNERFGLEGEDGEHRIDLPISRQDLAALIGTTPETMSRMIRRIHTDGLARFEGKAVRIRDIDAVCRSVQAPV